MSKFTFICEEKSMPFADVVSLKRTVEFEAVSLSDILNEVEMFLRGSGFYFDGTLDVVNEEEIVYQTVEPENINELLCPVCKISNHIMSKNDCYDKNCPKVN